MWFSKIWPWATGRGWFYGGRYYRPYMDFRYYWTIEYRWAFGGRAQWLFCSSTWYAVCLYPFASLFIPGAGLLGPSARGGSRGTEGPFPSVLSHCSYMSTLQQRLDSANIDQRHTDQCAHSSVPAWTGHYRITVQRRLDSTCHGRSYHQPIKGWNDHCKLFSLRDGTWPNGFPLQHLLSVVEWAMAFTRAAELYRGCEPPVAILCGLEAMTTPCASKSSGAALTLCPCISNLIMGSMPLYTAANLMW